MFTLPDSVEYLIQPGWKNSPDDHWQSHWQRTLGARRVENHDWDEPRLDDWLAGLEQAVAKASRPVVVVAHSLGCIAVAHYARRHHKGLAGALLVAPADVERAAAPATLAEFGPIPRERLPFPALVVASTNDPFCHASRAQEMALAWGAPVHWLAEAGHINVDSGHRVWPDGWRLLAALTRALRLPPGQMAY
ncbi:alpha/beta hydrolase [Crenobacter sp. SG2305]|uniref:RBBP9/YdeN family alpha/beta hydrolase n=1 Tax=Crenobacter oryzisoli TaxID=3056844 RepID=UPI0025AA5015|nr:alpha/beta hydrolase [Crenobacter sp. SG2305]MDN0083657.1 alpha/beta hydrolase [Crenobacter sp. SG2305]